MKPYLISLIFIFTVLEACQSPEKEKKVSREPPVNLAIRIWGEEGREFFHCLAQVQSNEPNAFPGKLNPGDYLSLDETRLVADSARFSGVFYQADLPMEQFSGDHAVSFISADGRTHSANFEFRPFSLDMDTGIALSPSEMDFQLRDLPEGDHMVHLLITDTSFSTDDINVLLPVKDGRLVVSQTLVSRLKKGPVVMQIIYEKEKTLSLGKNRVKLLVSYSLGREFFLK